MQKIVVPTEAELIQRLAAEIERCATEGICELNAFRVGLSGGSLVKYFAAALPLIKSDFSKWKFFFCDERYVPKTDADSNFGSYYEVLMPNSPLKVAQFVCPDTRLPLAECAKDYEAKVRHEFKDFNMDVPQFDLLLLGMGPDGHTCSLFPGHKLLKEDQQLIAAISDSPKPPAKRVTMTFPLINNAKCCIFAMSGAGKAGMVKRVFVDKEDLPAAMVSPKNGMLICIIDAAADGKSKYIPTTCK